MYIWKISESMGRKLQLCQDSFKMLCSPSPEYGFFSAVSVGTAKTPKYSLAWRSDGPQPCAGETLKDFPLWSLVLYCHLQDLKNLPLVSLQVQYVLLETPWNKCDHLRINPSNLFFTLQNLWWQDLLQCYLGFFPLFIDLYT